MSKTAKAKSSNFQSRHWSSPHNNYKHDPHVLSGFTDVCWSTLSGRHVPPVRSARSLRNHLSRGCADQVDDAAPPANFRLNAVGRKRQGRLYSVGGPSQVEGSNANAAAIASEPNPDALTHSTVHWTNRLTRKQDTRMAIAPYGDRRCSSHLSHQVRSMYEECKCTASPSPQFAFRSEAENA